VEEKGENLNILLKTFKKKKNENKNK